MNEILSKIQACDANQPFVFVSYSKQDAVRVYPFILRLQELGCNIWIDRELTKMVGRNWQLGAIQAMADENCRAILFMISEHSLKSAPVLAELSLSQKARKVLRKHGGSGIKIIPVNADGTWSQSKIGLATWIGNTVSLDDTPMTADDYACLDVGGGLLEDYTREDSLSRIDERGEIAQAILDDVLEPLGGGKITIASIEDLETVQENIDEECFNRKISRRSTAAVKAEQAVPTAMTDIAEERKQPAGAEVENRQTHVYPNGDVYEGEMKDGLRHGYGKMTYAGGDIYIGDYRKDKRHGHGRYQFANGNVYEGDYVDNKRTGHGVLRYANGEVYEGEFLDGRRSGYGKYTFLNGDVREGNWKDNKPI